MISLNAVTVNHHGRGLFKNLNLIIGDNEHYVIQGKNGSGKTSLLEILTGLIHCSSGTIKYNFIQDEMTWDEKFQLRKKNIHYIPTHALQQVMSSHPDFFYQQRYYTIGDVQLPTVSDFLGHTIQEIEAFNFPESFNIRQLLELEITRLSNGQLKKVLIIKHLLREIPKYLLLDYPFDGLDHESRQALCSFLDHLATALGIQILLTDHDHLLPSVINRKIVLEDGRITTQEAYFHQAAAPEKILSSHNPPPSDGDAIVEIKNLKIQYGSRTIIHNLNWKIQKGQRWALTGKNGSGKTTLFSLFYADHPIAYSQEVYLFGKRRGTGESIWSIKDRINYFGPEHIHFMNAKSIQQTGRQYLRSHKKYFTEQDIAGVIDFFDDTGFIDKPVKQYSSGQLQLLLLIMFFSDYKPLLLLDEPFQFLDPEMKSKVSKYLEKFLDNDITMIMITHDDRDVDKWTHLRLHLAASL